MKSFSSSSGEDSDELDGDAYSQLLQQVTGKVVRVGQQDDNDYESDSDENSDEDSAELFFNKQAVVVVQVNSVTDGSDLSSEEENEPEDNLSEKSLSQNDNFRKRFLSGRIGDTISNHDLGTIENVKLYTKKFSASSQTGTPSAEYLKPRLVIALGLDSNTSQYSGIESNKTPLPAFNPNYFST